MHENFIFISTAVICGNLVNFGFSEKLSLKVFTWTDNTDLVVKFRLSEYTST